MNLKKLVKDNWKGAVVGAAVMAAGAFGGPIAGKAVGFIVPKALEHVSDTPISDVKDHKSPFSKAAITHEPQIVELKISVREHATLADVAKDFGISGRLSCTVVEK